MNYNNVVKGQTKLDIILDTRLDLSDVTIALIKYRKPSGIVGSWTATIDNVVEGVIRYTVQSATDINELGAWVIWSYATFTDLTFIAGRPTNMFVVDEGEI